MPGFVLHGVVEYVPQYDEHLSPRAFLPADRLAPVSTAVPAERADDAVTEYTPSFADEGVARLAEVAEAESLMNHQLHPAAHAMVFRKVLLLAHHPNPLTISCLLN